MSRIQKLETIYKEQLTSKHIKDTSVFIQSIIDADITKGKYARFLLECFLNDKFLEEDLIGGLNSTVGQAISLFDKHKSKLPIEKRSVYALNKETGEALYQSPGDLWNSVKQFQGELSGKELKKEEQEKIYRETEFVYKDEKTGFQIISPLTEESAKWWGKGTRWCTSAENNNMFWNYAKDSPLFILLMPNGQKLQLWNNENDIQFMDEADKIVSKNYIKENWDILEPIVKDFRNIKYLPDEYLTTDKCLEAIKKDSKSFCSLPEKFKTKELCNYIMEYHPVFFQFLPDKYKEDMIKKYFNNTKEMIKYIPKEFRDYNLCLEAVKQNGMALEYVPIELRTPELCKLAIHNGLVSYTAIPSHIYDLELYELVVKNNGYYLQIIPENIINYKMCYNAILTDPNSFQYIPDEYRTYELCKKAMELAIENKTPISFKYLKTILNKYKTKELYELAVKNDGETLFLIPEEYKTQKLYNLAIRNNIDILFGIPEEYKTKEFYINMLSSSSKSIQLMDLLPEKLQTEEMFSIAIEQNGNNLQYIPKELITKKLCDLAFKNKKSGLEYIPEKYITKKQCLDAINKYPHFLSYIYHYSFKNDIYDTIIKHRPSDIKYLLFEDITPELCELAVKQNGLTLCHVPKHLKTQELCELAIINDSSAMAYVPDEHKPYITNQYFNQIKVKENYCFPNTF
jgi:hypothetical protein